MKRLAGLDLLRALAIVWVMLYHAIVMGVMPDSNEVAAFGWMGVDLFFALSGFLIGGQLFRPFVRGEPEHLGLFYARRLFRTLPPYLVIVTLYFTVPMFRERPTIQPLWQFLTFTENLFIDVSLPRAFSHVWSLCVEEQFYLIAPVVVWLLMRRPALWKAFAVCGVILVGGMVLRGSLWVHAVGPITSDPGNVYQRWYEHIYYPTWCRLDGLLGGMIFAAIRAFRPMWWQALLRHANLTLIVGAAGVAVAIRLFVDETAFLATVIGFPILSLSMAALVAAGASPQGLIGRWHVPGAGAIAAMAYSLYLTHKEMYHLTQMVAGARLDGHPILAVLIYGGTALAAGALLYAVAERPALIMRDRILAQHRRTTLVPHSLLNIEHVADPV
jgi:peptidoglycan/LPS O-acetylase OafA/YrhL